MTFVSGKILLGYYLFLEIGVATPASIWRKIKWILMSYTKKFRSVNYLVILKRRGRFTCLPDNE